MKPFSPKRSEPDAVEVPPPSLVDESSPMLHRMVCWLGVHDFELVEVSLSFVPGCGVEKLQCKRCGLLEVRQSS